MKNRFDDWRLGDRVFDTNLGWGEIVGYGAGDYPLTVKFGEGLTNNYDLNGYTAFVYETDGEPRRTQFPTLYWRTPYISGGDTPPKRMVKIGRYEYPEPESEPIELGENYWAASLDFLAEDEVSVFGHEWVNDSFDKLILERGFLHKDEMSALQHAEALFEFWQDSLEGRYSE